MVDALRECWRVLGDDGVLLDLRPVETPIPVERIDGDRVRKIGELDGTPGADQDAAAWSALERVRTEGRFERKRSVWFDVNLDCPSQAHLLDHLAAPSHRRRTPTPEMVQQIREASAGGERFRTRERLVLGTYRRLSG